MKFKVALSYIASSRLAIYMRNSLQERKKGRGERRGRKGGKKVVEKERKGGRRGKERGEVGRAGQGMGEPTFTVLYSSKGHRPIIILSEFTNELHNFKKWKVRTQEAVLSSSSRRSCQSMEDRWKVRVDRAQGRAQGWKKQAVGIQTGLNQPQEQA